MELLDNQKVLVSVDATNGETNSDGSPEKATVFNPSWTADKGVTVNPSADGMSADVIADDIAEGGAPISGTITFTASSAAELTAPDLTATATFVVSNPAANGVALNVGTPVAK